MSIQYRDITEWEVETIAGWQPFCGIKKVRKKRYITLKFASGNTLICSENHKIKRHDGLFVPCTRVRKGTKVIGKDKLEVVVEKNKITSDIELYDLIEVENGHEYLTNGVVSSNCAFIDNIEEIWLSSQYTLATGGKAVVLSTPNGVGNWFHKMWTESDAGKNEMNRITLPWHLHPERDQKWRDEQTKLSGEKGAAQECDCEFSTSGNTVIDIPVLQWYESTHVTEPIEKRGIDRGLWIYKYPEAGKDYMITADVARGDAADFNGAHAIAIEEIEQVAEYSGKLPTKEYAKALVTMATEYNNALLVVENANVGWAVIQEIIDIGYPNLFYSSGDLQYVDADNQMTNKINTAEKKMTPGFTTSNKSRPLLISKLESYIRDKECIFHSRRLLDELNVFIWKTTNGTSAKAEAMTGYNDDLVMSFAIGMWIRDVALRLRGESESITKTILSKIGSTSKDQITKNVSTLIKSAGNNPYGIYHNPWEMRVGGPGSGHKPEDLRWLLR